MAERISVIQRLRAWWWKRNHPVEYQILKTFVERFEAEVAERGYLFDLHPGNYEQRMRVQMYGDLAMIARRGDLICVTVD